MMKFPEDKNSLQYQITKPVITIVLSLLALNILVIGIIFTIQGQANMKSTAELIIEQMDIMWDYINDNQDTINYTSDGEYEYKGIHCAIAGTDIAEELTSRTTYYVRYVQDDPRSNMNIPNIYESEAIAEFSEGTSEAYGFTFNRVGQYVFYYLEPLYIEESCLECHGEPIGEIDVSGYEKEGLSIGDQYGAVSITIQAMPYVKQAMINVAIEVIIFTVLLMVIAYIVYRIILKRVLVPLNALELEVNKLHQGNFNIEVESIEADGEIASLRDGFQNMATQLNTLYTDLEGQVELRTEQLSEMNTTLQELNTQLADDNNYKSEFLATMSHELRTPLSSVIAFAEILTTQNNLEDTKTQDIANEILNNSKFLLSLINNILEMARIEAGRAELAHDVIDMVDLVGEVERVLTPLAGKKNISLITQVNESLPLIFGDWDKLRRMIENIAGNAVKFTDINGEVAINVDFDTTGKNIEIKVKDNGTGIAEEQIALIFEKFVQGDSSDKRNSNGTGLGLALAQSIVEMHGGTIDVNSQLGIGCEFIINIPITAINEEESYENNVSR